MSTRMAQVKRPGSALHTSGQDVVASGAKIESIGCCSIRLGDIGLEVEAESAAALNLVGSANTGPNHGYGATVHLADSQLCLCEERGERRLTTRLHESLHRSLIHLDVYVREGVTSTQS